jgi:putative redox protein
MKNDRPGNASDLRAELTIGIQWKGERTFDAGRPGGPTIRIDGDSKQSVSPPEALIAALASCTAVDVVDILKKRRTPPTSLDIDVIAERAEGTPRRVTKVHLGYRIVGHGIDPAQAERAIELGVTKYCTVRDSMDPEMPVTWSLELSEG